MTCGAVIRAGLIGAAVVCADLALQAPAAAAQSDRVVALVVSVGDGAARADGVQSALQSIGAETLRSVDPNNAELRSMVRRFADEAEDARATFVYLDMPAVVFAGREYVLADSAALLNYSVELDRPTDLFANSIPLLAFARTAALAEQGGAVAITVSAPPGGLPDGLRPLAEAPAPVQGASAIMVVPAAAADPVLQRITAAAEAEAVDVSALLAQVSGQNGVSLSAVPDTAIILKSAPPVPAVPPAPIPAAVPGVPTAAPIVPDTVAEPVPAPEPVAVAPTTETLAELEIFEQSLSRSAKRAIQRELRRLGHYRGLVDGIFGPQTRQAITLFQTERSDPPTGLLSRRQLLDLRTSG